MTICEKCWSDSYTRSLSNQNKTRWQHYIDLLDERKTNPCSKEEQKGVKS